MFFHIVDFKTETQDFSDLFLLLKLEGGQIKNHI